jgi:hypothetical protein
MMYIRNAPQHIIYIYIYIKLSGRYQRHEMLKKKRANVEMHVRSHKKHVNIEAVTVQLLSFS